jgi:hypothetical protein
VRQLIIVGSSHATNCVVANRPLSCGPSRLYTMVMVVTTLLTSIYGGGTLALGLVSYVSGQIQGRAKGKREAKAAADAARAAELGLQANPTTDQPSRLSDGVYRFRVTNVGQSAARHLSPLLVDDHGRVWSEPLDPMVLQPQASTTFTIRVLEPSPGLYLDYTWFDDSSNSQQRDRSAVAVPTNA